LFINLKDVQLERNIIAGVFKDKDNVDNFVNDTKPEYFTDDKCRQAKEWIDKQYSRNKTISVIKASEVVELNDIVYEDILIFEFDSWLESLHKYYVRRSIKNKTQEIYDLVKDPEKEVEEYMSEAQELIFSATIEFNNEDGNKNFEEAMMESYRNYITELENGEVSGIKTGFPSVDNTTGGLQNGHLTVIAGSTSMGKTALSLSLTDNLIKDDNNVYFVSLEMKAKELSDRMLVMNSKISASDYNKRRLNDTQQEILENTRSHMTKYYDYLDINEKRGMTVEEIKANCRKQYNKKNIDLIIIDYLQNIKLPNKRSTNKEVGEAVKNIRDFAGELNVPIILLSQLNRSVEGRPKLKHLRDSGEIEEASDEVWFVYRPDYNKNIAEQEEVRQEAELIHAKGRTSGIGVSNFYFYPEITLWRDAYWEDRGKKEPIKVIRRSNGLW
jgi:replicative DNA helicase